VIHFCVLLIRGTPLFVQVLIFYFALPEALGISLSPFAAGVIALGINASAYVSEIVRCGINSIPIGQWEAAYALGYRPSQLLQSVILPQMLRNVLPALTNEMTALIKETSILMAIGVSELTKVGREIVARQLDPMSIYLTVAGIYFVMTSAVSLCARYIERKV
jgi:ABC-type amino acid transport system permease subunit